MDFMQCINFKSRLDREREMIRRKIRSSTLYRKPSFTKSAGFNIYNANGDISKVSCISKNIKINEFRDEPLRKIKSPLLVGDEVEDENSSEDKRILCIGNKYLDLTSNLLTSSLGKSVSTSTLSLINNELSAERSNDTDFERAISQSHLSPSSQPMCLSPNNLFLKKQIMREAEHMQENLIKPKTAKAHNVTAAKSDDSKTPTDSNDGEETQDFQSPSASEQLKRKDHNKLIKKSTHSFYAVGINVGKYSDAQKTEVALDDLPNSIVTNNNQNKTHNTSASSKAKKSGISSRKKSSHSKKSDKNNSPKTTAARKSEISS